MGIDDQAGHFIVFVGNHGLVQELLQRDIGQRNPRRDHLLGAVGRDPGEAVAGAWWRRLGQEITQIVKDINGGIYGVAIDHGCSRPSARLRQQPP